MSHACPICPSVAMTHFVYCPSHNGILDLDCLRFCAQLSFLLEWSEASYLFPLSKILTPIASDMVRVLYCLAD